MAHGDAKGTIVPGTILPNRERSRYYHHAARETRIVAEPSACAYLDFRKLPVRQGMAVEWSLLTARAS